MMMMRFVRLPLLGCALLLVSACGLRPLYGGGSNSAVVGLLAGVDVAPVDGQAGWLVRNALRERLAASRGGTDVSPGAYRLDVRLDDNITGFGVRTDDAVTRERRTLRARYQLVDGSSGEVLVDATASVDAGIDVVGSEYATIAAEQSALERLAGQLADQIITRLAIYGDHQARTGVTVAP